MSYFPVVEDWTGEKQKTRERELHDALSQRSQAQAAAGYEGTLEGNQNEGSGMGGNSNDT